MGWQGVPQWRHDASCKGTGWDVCGYLRIPQDSNIENLSTTASSYFLPLSRFCWSFLRELSISGFTASQETTFGPFAFGLQKDSGFGCRKRWPFGMPRSSVDFRPWEKVHFGLSLGWMRWACPTIFRHGKMPSLGNDISLTWRVHKAFESLGVTFLGNFHEFGQAKLHKESKYGCMTLGIKGAITCELPSEILAYQY